ncbi:hypothetical protein BAE44_0001909 [Dichanthelium oligosanthes]|uniref:FBD domain-containing protein n=1 Tax=Dichanthelium oligosanthes TaxID=888268 RepID=A0A1E5WI41_9POAL|nr:hypothetical protein BAE44_0001909 [Dichanthelium oligosanthes]
MSLLDIHVSRHHHLKPRNVTSLLCSAMRLAPAELKVVFSGAIQYSGNNARYPVEDEIPCFDQTTSISISVFFPLVHLALPLAGDFLKLESLSLRSCMTTEAVLQRVDIWAPLLKKLSIYVDVGISDEFSLPYSSAPKLEELSLRCGHCLSNVGFGIWCLSSMIFVTTPKPLGHRQLVNDKESTSLQPQHCCPRVDLHGMPPNCSVFRVFWKMYPEA